MKNVKVIKKAAIFLMVFVLAFSSLSAAAAVTYSRGGKRVRLVCSLLGRQLKKIKLFI